MVLNNVSFTVKPGEKVGVCGRTGSGKSSLMLTLFRILELDEKAKGAGTISIDGQDISTLGLTQLRKAIAMLPQVQSSCYTRAHAHTQHTAHSTHAHTTHNTQHNTHTHTHCRATRALKGLCCVSP